MQDRFTKWIELKPLRRVTAPAVTQAILKCIIYRYGCPELIISDNGTQLKSTQLAETLRAFDIKHRTTPVHAPHCNPVKVRTDKPDDQNHDCPIYGEKPPVGRLTRPHTIRVQRRATRGYRIHTGVSESWSGTRSPPPGRPQTGNQGEAPPPSPPTRGSFRGRPSQNGPSISKSTGALQSTTPGLETPHRRYRMETRISALEKGNRLQRKTSSSIYRPAGSPEDRVTRYS